MTAIVEPSLAREVPTGEGVRVWTASLDHADEIIQRMSAILSGDERARAEELHGAAKRNCFIVARGILRTLLGEATKTAPGRVAFRYGPDGKPALANNSAGSGVQFNVSHSRNLALFAIAEDRRTGIDVEWTEGSYPIEGVAKRFFSAAEQAALAESPASERRRAFFRIWVRKEAYVKGRGEGISQWIYDTDLSRLSVSDGASGGDATRDQDGWFVRDIGDLAPGFVASVAIERGSR